MRNGKKPTRKQKIRLGQAGLSPENWLVVRQKQNSNEPPTSSPSGGGRPCPGSGSRAIPGTRSDLGTVRS